MASCGGATPPVTIAPPPSSGWSYVFRLDPPMRVIDARLCFHGAAPALLSPIHASGWRYVRAATWNGRQLPRRRGGYDTSALPDDACVDYRVDLAEAIRRSSGMSGAHALGGDVIASTAVWLWAPRERANDASVSARFELPQGIRVSSLWPRSEDGTYSLDDRAFGFVGYAAFGSFEVRHVAVPGACLEVAVVGGTLRMGDEAMERALVSVASSAASLRGTFPAREASVIIVAVPGVEDIPFGMAGRGTRPTVVIVAGADAQERALATAWVPVHEFDHLETPVFAASDQWLSEGLATYYQEVLRARAGLITHQRAWELIHGGFGRGEMQSTGQTLAEDSAGMHRTTAYARVYWAGAALCMMIDVALRQRGSSLDEALARLPLEDHTITAADAIRAIDGDGPPIARTIAERWLSAREFPDYGDAYRALGLRDSDGWIEVGGGAEQEALREAILHPPPPLAPAPEGCAEML